MEEPRSSPGSGGTGEKRQPASAVTQVVMAQPRRAEDKRLTSARMQERSPVRAALAVGGAGALRAEIFVNGRSMGHAPQLLELPVGEHTLELVSPEGTRVGPKRLKLTELHTRAAPLRWVVPGTSEVPAASGQP
jgi:hypothetical protein